MAKASSSKRVTPRNTNSKSNPNRSSRRAKPMTPKASVTRSGRRSYGAGGQA